MAFLPYPVIDLYIRAFVNGSQPYSEHRYFIDLRPNTPGHLWLGFALSPKGTVAGADSRLQRAVSVAENTFRFFQRSIKGSVSGRYPVIPLLRISVRKVVAFPSLLPLCREIPRRVYMRQRVAALSKGASRAPQEIKILLAVLPALSLNLAYWRTAKWSGLRFFSSSNIKSTGFLKSSSSSRTSIALINSMSVEKFCSSTGAS